MPLVCQGVVLDLTRVVRPHKGKGKYAKKEKGFVRVTHENSLLEGLAVLTLTWFPPGSS